MNFDISAMKLRAKSLVKQCGNTPALIEALLWLLRVIAVMCGSLSTQNGSIGGYIISGVATLLLIFLLVGSEWYTLNVAREETPDFQSVFDGITKMPIKVLLITIIRSIMCYVFAIFNCSDNIPDILVQTCFLHSKGQTGNVVYKSYG